jgi:membrane protein required for colicin V production
MSGPDRALGAVFGLFKGLLVAAVVVTLVQMTPLRSTDTWRQAQSVNWMRAALRGLSPLLPEAVAREVAWGG